MKVILIISLILLIAGVVLWIHDCITRRHNGGSVTSEEVQSAATAQEDEADSEDCCGMHMTCERDSLLTAVSPEVVYYDDEELDRFRGRGADDYSDEEIEEFRDVLLTLLPDDIAGWGRSIQMHDINLPTSIRQELLMIVAEAREARSRQHA